MCFTIEFWTLDIYWRETILCCVQRMFVFLVEERDRKAIHKQSDHEHRAWGKLKKMQPLSLLSCCRSPVVVASHTLKTPVVGDELCDLWYVLVLREGVLFFSIWSLWKFSHCEQLSFNIYAVNARWKEVKILEEEEKSLSSVHCVASSIRQCL
jgi:hypothetical protein